MKKLLLLAVSVCLILTLTGQSNLLTVGGVYRNTNQLSHTGKLPIGLQVGYSHRFTDGLMLQANLGYVTNQWDIERQGIFIFQDRERTDFLEAYVFVPFLKRWFDSDKLQFGAGYTFSRNEHDYVEYALVNPNGIETLVTRDPVYYLHEIGAKIQYTQPLSDRLSIILNGGGNISLNPGPAYESVITRNDGFGRSTSTTKKPERLAIHYQVALGIGYKF